MKNMRFLFVIPVFLLLFFASANTALSGEYVVGEGDRFRITVYDHPDLTIEVRVGGDGMISMPLIGEVNVGGLTVTEVEKKIAALLADGYIIKPHVTLFMLEYKIKKVTVLGEFVKPGLIELLRYSSLLEVISNAGGLTEKAGDMLYIKRKIAAGEAKPTGKEKEADTSTITVELKKLLEEGNPEANLTVYDGDNIYVPRAAFIYVNGEIRTPGAYKITKGLTVLKAITLAGGFTQKAAESSTKIIRKVGASEITKRASLDELVQPDDIILVPESIF
ncbi:MAG: SLBB domain-containing protein [Deltaproteobacteria bacterium]|nr:SLBB domain-containing protein [Deltaproteobacteria bacterium]